MKLYTLVFLLLFSKLAFSIKTVGRDFPEKLKNIFAEYGQNAHQYFDGKDVHGRDHIVVVCSNGQEYRYAIYQDETGTMWNILIDEENLREIPFIKIKLRDGTTKAYHPKTVEKLELEKLVSPESCMYLPDNAPCLHGYTR